MNEQRVLVPPGENPEPAMAYLWEILNRVDPIAKTVGAVAAILLTVLSPG